MKSLHRLWHTHHESLQNVSYLTELKRAWAIETGRIENLYSLSDGTTRTLIRIGIISSLIPPTDQSLSSIPAEEITRIIKDQYKVRSLLIE